MRALLVVLLLSLTSCSADADQAPTADGVAGYGVAPPRPSATKAPMARAATRAATRADADGVVQSYDAATGDAIVTDWEGHDYAVPGEGLADATYVTFSGLSAPLTSTDEREGRVDGSEGEAVVGQGFVKWFNADKGYGFITRDVGGDLFVHHSAIRSSGYRTLSAGQRVDFEVSPGPAGDRATEVVVVG